MEVTIFMYFINVIGVIKNYTNIINVANVNQYFIVRNTNSIQGVKFGGVFTNNIILQSNDGDTYYNILNTISNDDENWREF